MFPALNTPVPLPNRIAGAPHLRIPNQPQEAIV